MVPKEVTLLSAAKYGELEQYMESKTSAVKKISNMDLWHLCSAYSKAKNYRKLTPCLDEMQDRVNAGNNQIIFFGSPVYDMKIDCPVMRAQAAIELGDYQAAIKDGLTAYQNAKSIEYSVIPATKRLWLVQAIDVLGLAYALNGDHELALARARELSGLSTSYPYGIVGYAQKMGAAKIYMTLGDYNHAIEELMWEGGIVSKALVNAVVLATLQIDDIWSFVGLPRAYLTYKALLETGAIIKAKDGFDALLRVPQISENGEIYWMVLYERGRIADMEKEYALAIDLYARAITVIEEQRSTINTEVNKIGFVGDKQAVYRDIVDLLVGQNLYADAFNYAERAKSRALVDMLSFREQFSKTDIKHTSSADLIAKLNAAELESKRQDETASTGKANQRRAIAIKIKEEIGKVDPELASLVAVSAPKISEIQQMIPEGETLIEYFGSGDTYYTFIVTRNHIEGTKLRAENLRQKIESFRYNIMINDSTQFKDNGNALYEIIFKPIEEMLSTTNLTIVPHGILHYLPFNALSSKGGYLIDRYKIRILPSASVLKYLKIGDKNRPGGLIVFGNPDLGDLRYDLPFAQDEAINIAKESPNAKVLLREQASETAVKKYGGQFKFVHFACHGTFNTQKPLESGLMLTKDSENDGTLTVGELYGIRLPADLVTLSACETALGKVASGDDVVGFTRGFLYAGTSSIVSSLWKVDDKATSVLMREFYKNLNITDKRNALRSAQLYVRDSHNSHPYYWAAFQITGSTH